MSSLLLLQRDRTNLIISAADKSDQAKNKKNASFSQKDPMTSSSSVKSLYAGQKQPCKIPTDFFFINFSGKFSGRKKSRSHANPPPTSDLNVHPSLKSACSRMS